MSELATLQESLKKQGEGIVALTKGLKTMEDRLAKAPAYPPGATPYNVLGAPHIRQGEDPLNSRGFSFLKMLGLVTGVINPDEAKVEIDVHNRMHKAYDTAYTYKGLQPGTRAFLAPLSTSYLHDQYVDGKTRHEFKSLILAGADGAELDHMNWLRTKQLQGMGYGQKDLSWLHELTGGALVKPPEMGELIELLRNKEALVNAGARTVPLPPQGRLTYPRHTAASTTYWIGENKAIPSSDIGTSEMTLQAKKLAVLIRMPNELIRFASPSAEALVRDDMTKSLALALDLAGLEGAGGDTRPQGVLNRQSVQTITSSKATANGDSLAGADIYRMIAAIEEANAEMEGWIMRPKTLYAWYQLRADGVSQDDHAGPFLFNLIREAAEGVKATLGGYPVTKSTQVSQVRSKGSASNLTYMIGGMWSDILIGMFGGVEFASTTQGAEFAQDQTSVRGILSADIGVRHEAAFCYMDNLDLGLVR